MFFSWDGLIGRSTSSYKVSILLPVPLYHLHFSRLEILFCFVLFFFFFHLFLSYSFFCNFFISPFSNFVHYFNLERFVLLTLCGPSNRFFEYVLFCSVGTSAS